MNDNYQSILIQAEAEFKEKGSRFIAYAFPFKDELQLKPIIESLKSRHPKARHHCFAYKIGLSKDRFRTFDDGEPSGSAGKPIFNVILSKGLSDILIVVVRYFGGTLLGVPGLINAYKSATNEVLQNANLTTTNHYNKVRLVFSFDAMNDLMKIVKDYQLKIVEQKFEENCCFELDIKMSETFKIIELFHDLRSFEIAILE